MAANGVFLAFSIATFAGIYIETIKELFDENEEKQILKLLLLRNSMWFVIGLTFMSMISIFLTFLGMKISLINEPNTTKWAWIIFGITVIVFFGVMLYGAIYISKTIKKANVEERSKDLSEENGLN